MDWLVFCAPSVLWCCWFADISDNCLQRFSFTAGRWLKSNDHDVTHCFSFTFQLFIHLQCQARRPALLQPHGPNEGRLGWLGQCNLLHSQTVYHIIQLPNRTWHWSPLLVKLCRHHIQHNTDRYNITNNDIDSLTEWSLTYHCCSSHRHTDRVVSSGQTEWSLVVTYYCCSSHRHTDRVVSSGHLPLL